MCDRCDVIDYPVADCWRPCYVPPRARAPLPTPGRMYNEDDFTAQETLAILRRTILAQQKTITHLKARNTAISKSRATDRPFRGVE